MYASAETSPAPLTDESLPFDFVYYGQAAEQLPVPVESVPEQPAPTTIMRPIGLMFGAQIAMAILVAWGMVWSGTRSVADDQRPIAYAEKLFLDPDTTGSLSYLLRSTFAD